MRERIEEVRKVQRLDQGILELFNIGTSRYAGTDTVF